MRQMVGDWATGPGELQWLVLLLFLIVFDTRSADIMAYCTIVRSSHDTEGDMAEACVVPRWI
eukprot:scaffold34103_cov90-Cyclotella_meneghiniana.AAC.4